MIDPAVFRAMVANGATPEMLLAVVEAAAAVEEEKRAKKRAGNAERQARFRAKNAGQGAGDNASNALQAVTERDSVTPPPTPSPSSSPDPSNNPTHTPGNQPRARKGTRLPDDWQPAALADSDGAMVAQWPPGTVEREMAKFRDFWAAKAGAGGVKLDWQATWRNWLRQADERIPKHANRQQQPSSQHGSRTGYGRTGDAAQRFLQAGGHH